MSLIFFIWSLFFTSQKIMVSSANCKCMIMGAFAAGIKPLIKNKYLAASAIWLKASPTITNKKGERGSPWQRPLCARKNPLNKKEHRGYTFFNPPPAPPWTKIHPVKQVMMDTFIGNENLIQNLPSMNKSTLRRRDKRRTNHLKTARLESVARML